MHLRDLKGSEGVVRARCEPLFAGVRLHPALMASASAAWHRMRSLPLELLVAECDALRITAPLCTAPHTHTLVLAAARRRRRFSFPGSIARMCPVEELNMARASRFGLGAEAGGIGEAPHTAGTSTRSSSASAYNMDVLAQTEKKLLVRRGKDARGRWRRRW